MAREGLIDQHIDALLNRIWRQIRPRELSDALRFKSGEPERPAFVVMGAEHWQRLCATSYTVAGSTFAPCQDPPSIFGIPILRLGPGVKGCEVVWPGDLRGFPLPRQSDRASAS